ncbi:MAG: hypothetical protein K940chlam7_01940, partial [Chlamydiae bacterium]|nr:hypothetical protein [Chlamydiota bacterium]
IKPYKWSLFGVKNPRKAYTHVLDAMEVHGKILEGETSNKKVYLLIPESEIEQYHVNDKVILSVAKKRYCFKIQPMQ